MKLINCLIVSVILMLVTAPYWVNVGRDLPPGYILKTDGRLWKFSNTNQWTGDDWDDHWTKAGAIGHAWRDYKIGKEIEHDKHAFTNAP